MSSSSSSSSSLFLLYLRFFDAGQDGTPLDAEKKSRLADVRDDTDDVGEEQHRWIGTASLDKKRRTRCEARGRGGEEEEEEEKQRREIKVCTKKECRRLGSQKTIEFLEERAGKRVIYE